MDLSLNLLVAGNGAEAPHPTPYEHAYLLHRVTK